MPRSDASSSAPFPRFAGTSEARGAARATPRGGRKVAHDAGLGDAMLAVLALGRAKKVDVRAVETDDGVLGSSVAFLRADGHAVRTPLQPDAYVLTSDERGPRGLLVEYDRATTSVARMRDKYEAYAAWREGGGPERTFQVKAMRVLTIVPDEPRLARLHDAALGEIVQACRSRGLPALAAIVVRRDLRVPGDKYYAVAHPHARGDRPTEMLGWVYEFWAASSQRFPSRL